MNSVETGRVAEMKVATEIVSMGYTVLEPVCNSERYDLMIDSEGSIYRIQVKNLREVPEGVGEYKATLYNMNSRSNEKKYYTSEDIDAFAFYSPDLDECYWVDINDAPKKSITLRTESKQPQNPNIRWVEDYILNESMDIS